MRKRSLKLGGSTTTPFARTVRSAIARQISLLSTRGGLDGCRRLALRMFQIWTDSQYPCSGCRGQVIAPSVRNCLDDEGVDVLVCTGTDPNEKELLTAEANLKKSFEQCGYGDA